MTPSQINQHSTYRQEKKNKKVLLTYLLIIPLLFIGLITNTEVYDRESYLYGEFLRDGGCSLSTCPEIIKGDTVYYADYEYGTKEYWRAYCNSFINTKFACK